MSELVSYRISSNVILGKKRTPKYFMKDYRRAKSIKDFVDTKYITSVEELKKYSFAQNTRIDADTTYILHPYCNNLLIEKNNFFEYIIREQINEIITYITSSFSINELTVNVINKKSHLAELTTKLEDVLCSVGFDRKSKYLCSVKIGQTKRHGSNMDYIWLKNMPILVNAVRLKSSHVNIKQEIDNSFGINMPFASAVGLNLNALKHCCFEISYSIAQDYSN